MPLRNISVVGASGLLGAKVLKRLQAEPSLVIKLLARPSSNLHSEPPQNTIVTSVDFDSVDSLAAAMEGTDAVISFLPLGPTAKHKKLIDAAIKASVRVFIPSEFGNDTMNELVADLPLYREGKVVDLKYLQTKAEQGLIEWTGLITSVWFDIVIKIGLLGIDVSKKSATLFGGGTNLFSMTMSEEVAKATVQLLVKYDEISAKNRLVFVESVRITQKQLLQIFEDVTGTKFSIENVSFEDLKRIAYEKAENGEPDAYIQELQLALMHPDMGGNHEGKAITESLGLKMLNDAEVRKIVEDVVASAQAG